METTKRTVVLLSLVLFIAGVVQSAEKPAGEISNTRTASCLVKVTSDPAILPLAFEKSVDALLRSSGVGGKAAREVLGISPDNIQDLIEIKYVQFLEFLDSATVQATPSAGPRSTPRGLEEYEELEEDYEEMMMEEMMGTGTPPYAPRGSSAAAKQQPQQTSRYRSRGLYDAYYFGRRPTSEARPTAAAPSLTLAAEKAIIFHLVVQLEENIKPAAEEFMNGVIDNLRSALFNAFNVDRNKLRQQLELAQKEATRAEQNLVQMQHELRDISGSRDLSRPVILAEIRRLRGEIDNAEMDQARNRATMQATTKQIAEIEAKTKEQLENDTITKELERILNVQLQNLENTKKLADGGRARPAELADAEEKLARARIELARRRDEISRSEGGNRLSSLNTGLAAYSLNMAQNEAYFADLRRKLVETEDLVARADTYELLSLKADIAKQNLEEALLWRDRMERTIRLVQPPTITVLGAD